MQSVTKKAYRLSIQQARLWTGQQGYIPYRPVCRVRLEGQLEMALFQQALQKLVARHAILRTEVCYLPSIGLPLQMVSEDGSIVSSWVNLEQMSSPEQEAQVLSYIHDLQIAPFAENLVPDLLCIVCSLSARQHILLFSISLFCSDAATLRNLLIELARLYEVSLCGEVLPDEQLQYIDVSS